MRDGSAPGQCSVNAGVLAPAPRLDTERRPRQNRAVTRRSALVLAASMLLAACGARGDAGSGASCDAGGARFLAIARAQLAARPDADATVRTGVEGLLAPIRDGMVKAC